MWVVKWIIFPLVILVILCWAYASESYKRQCKRLCREKGYQEWSIFPGRNGERTSCVLSGKILSDGTVDKDARETIYLDE